MRDIRLNRYLHQPIQVLWFDQHELTLIVLCYAFGMLFGGVMWLTFFALPFFFKYKRSQDRGYFGQLSYFYGFTEIKLYPDPSENRFFE